MIELYSIQQNYILAFDPATFLSQLNNLQANQIDDLESALLPHLNGMLSLSSRQFYFQTFDLEMYHAKLPKIN